VSALNELIEDYKEYLDGPNDPYLNGWRAGYASALQAVAKALPDHEAESRNIYRFHSEGA